MDQVTEFLRGAAVAAGAEGGDGGTGASVEGSSIFAGVGYLASLVF